MESTLPVSTQIMMAIVFAIITFLFAVAIAAFVNPKVREKVLGLLPFSNANGGKQPNIAVVIIIIAGAMVAAYFF